ncbi:hypothetical protein Bca4012_051522 [Brassica carinata]
MAAIGTRVHRVLRSVASQSDNGVFNNIFVRRFPGLSFLRVPLPSDLFDMEKELQKIGFKPVRNTAQRRAAAQIQGITQKTRQDSPAHLFRISSKASRPTVPETNLINE